MDNKTNFDFHFHNQKTSDLNASAKEPFTYNNYSSLSLHILSFLSIILLIVLGILFYLTINHFVLHSPSNIVSQKDLALISYWINPFVSLNYILLYRASKDTDSSLIFHKHCDNKGNTLVVIETTKGWKFGGFVDIDWESYKDSGIWEYKYSTDTFLFSINKQTKYPIKQQNKAIFCNSKKGPTFGFGHDLSVADNCFTTPSTCRSPYSFSNVQNKNEFNGGEDSFLVKELEVFLVRVNSKY